LKDMLDRKYSNRLIFTTLLLLFSAGIFFLLPKNLEKEEKIFWKNKIDEIKIGENIFRAEIADTSSKRKQGLSGRKDLCEDCAMLFLFEEKGLYPFWMKKMNFDLDMIWIDKNRIVYLAKNVSQKEEFKIIEPEFQADKVLEINAGLADKLDIKIGDNVEF
jgi:uncharacterized membrane protein (UPF0127 family)